MINVKPRRHIKFIKIYFLSVMCKKVQTGAPIVYLDSPFQSKILTTSNPLEQAIMSLFFPTVTPIGKFNPVGSLLAFEAFLPIFLTNSAKITRLQNYHKIIIQFIFSVRQKKLIICFSGTFF